MGKLQQLCEIEGFEDEVALGNAYIMDSVTPGICMNPGCDYTTEVEPDQRRGYCEVCGTNTVKSAFVIMGVI